MRSSGWMQRRSKRALKSWRQFNNIFSRIFHYQLFSPKKQANRVKKHILIKRPAIHHAFFAGFCVIKSSFFQFFVNTYFQMVRAQIVVQISGRWNARFSVIYSHTPTARACQRFVLWTPTEFSAEITESSVCSSNAIPAVDALCFVAVSWFIFRKSQIPFSRQITQFFYSALCTLINGQTLLCRKLIFPSTMLVKLLAIFHVSTRSLFSFTTHEQFPAQYICFIMLFSSPPFFLR